MKRLLVAVLLLIVGVACGEDDSTNVATANIAATTTAPCASQAGSPTRVLIVILENHSFDQVAGQMPYLNNLATKCELLTGMHAISHPSLPNYLALTSGSTDGVTDDKSPSAHPISADNLFHQLGSQWADYAESMPTPCDAGNAFPYIVHHNPAPYYTDIKGSACQAGNVAYTHLATDLASPSSFPTASIVVPNKCHDGHKLSSTETGKCGSGTELSRADAWLSTELPKIFASATYQAGDLLVVVTWDEGSKARNPATDPIYTVLAAPTLTPGAKITTSLSHYSLLRYAEDLAGAPCLKGACTANLLQGAGL